MTPDPAGFVDGLNLYCYTLNNPVMFSDPSGLYWGASVGCPEHQEQMRISKILIYSKINGHLAYADWVKRAKGTPRMGLNKNDQPENEISKPQDDDVNNGVEQKGKNKKKKKKKNKRDDNDGGDDPDGKIKKDNDKKKDSEHTRNKRPSTKGKHEKGQSRKNRDNRGGEKGDKRRPY